MANLLGKLAVAVVGDINQLKGAFKDVKKETKDLDKEVKKSGLGLKQIAGYATVAGAAVVSSLGAMAIAVSNSADNIDYLAKRTGITREALQALDYAAQQENTSIEALSTGLARLSRNMYDAERGVGTAKIALEDLGIALKDSDGNLRSVEDVLFDIADRMQGMSNETEMSALAMQVLGRSGADLVPFLRNGGDGIRQLMQEARDLGYVIKEESVKEMEAFADELLTVKTGLQGIGRQIASDVVPYFKAFIEAIISVQKWIHQLPEPIRKTFTVSTLLAGAIALIGGGLTSLIVKIAATKTALATLNASFTPFLVGGAIVAGIGLLINKFSELKENARLAAMEIDKTFSLADLNAEKQRLEKAIKDAEERRANLAKEQEEWEKSDKKPRPKAGYGFVGVTMPAQTGDQTEVISNLDTNLQGLKTRLEEVTDRIEKLQKGAAGLEEEFVLTDYVEELSKNLANIDKVAKALGDTSNVAADKASLLKSAIKKMVEEGTNPTQVKLFGKSIIDLYREFDNLANKTDASVYDVNAALTTLEKSLAGVDNKAFVLGDEFDTNTEKANLYLNTILDLMANGIDPTTTSLGDLLEKYRQLRKASDDAAAAAKLEADSKSLLTQAAKETENWRNREKSSLELLAEQLEEQAKLDEKNRVNLLAMAEAMRELAKEQNAVNEALEQAARSKDLMSQATAELEAWNNREKNSLELLAGQLIAQAALDEENKDKLLELAEAIKKLAQEQQQFTNQEKAVNLLADAQRRLADMTGTALPEWETFAQELEKAAAADGVLPEVAKQLQELAASIRAVGQASVETKPTTFTEAWNTGLKSVFSDAKTYLGHVQELAATTAKAMGDTFSSIFYDGVHGKLESLADYAQAVFDSISRAWANMMGQMLAQAAFDYMFPGAGIGFGGGRANGGPVLGGTAYLVGERGPEIFVPRSNGTIVPNASVEVNLINQSGQPLNAKQGDVKFDGKRYVVGVLIEAVSDNTGGIRDILKGGG